MPRQQVGEGAAGLERAGVLELFELQRQLKRRQTEIGATDGDDRRPPDVRRDDG